MIKGTTPTHTFEIPFDTSLIKTVKIIYVQDDEIVLCKKNNEITIKDGVIEVKLSQEDTFLFDCQKPVKIKIRILSSGGEALVSQTFNEVIEDCYDNEVLV